MRNNKQKTSKGPNTSLLLNHCSHGDGFVCICLGTEVKWEQDEWNKHGINLDNDNFPQISIKMNIFCFLYSYAEK